MKYYYVVLKRPDNLEFPLQLACDDFLEDYFLNYSPRFYTILEMIFVDTLYQVLLDSHLLKDERNQFVTKIKKQFNSEIKIDYTGIEYEDVLHEKNMAQIKYSEYMTSAFTDKCRMFAIKLLDDIKWGNISIDDFIENLKQSETTYEFNNNISKYIPTIAKFAKVVKEDTKNSVILCATQPCDDWFIEQGIVYVAF